MNLLISSNAVTFMAIDPDELKDYYASKLCFLEYHYEDDKDDTKEILIHDGNILQYNPLQNIYTFPHGIDTFQRCFLMRLIIDAEQLKRGNLPLHAAAVGDGERVFIIMAPPGKGKSFLTEEICRKYDCCETIGDDHVILTPMHVQGNLRRRIRNKNGDTVKYAENKGLCKRYPLTWICIEHQEADREPVFLSNKMALDALANASAFKYLNETFTHNGVSYLASAMADFDINETYRSCFDAFLKGDSVVLIRGTLSFALNTIVNVISRGKK